jgi:hypothetical protein
MRVVEVIQAPSFAMRAIDQIDRDRGREFDADRRPQRLILSERRPTVGLVFHESSRSRNRSRRARSSAVSSRAASSTGMGAFASI